jgi:hypothetical protein
MLAIEGRAALPEEKFNEVSSVYTEKIQCTTLYFSYIPWVITERHINFKLLVFYEMMPDIVRVTEGWNGWDLQVVWYLKGNKIKEVKSSSEEGDKNA